MYCSFGFTGRRIKILPSLFLHHSTFDARQVLVDATITAVPIVSLRQAAEMFKLNKEDLWEDIDGILTIGQFYELYTPGSQIIFI